MITSHIDTFASWEINANSIGEGGDVHYWEIASGNLAHANGSARGREPLADGSIL